eukprot:scaffold295653_cov29-Prasinocladus_malaysianus.AAC.1
MLLDTQLCRKEVVGLCASHCFLSASSVDFEVFYLISSRRGVACLVLCQVLGVWAAFQFLTKKLLFAEDREATFAELK